MGSSAEDGVRVTRLQRARAPAAGRLLAASHADYPAFVHAFPAASRRRRVLPVFLTATARDAAGCGGALVADDGRGLVGAALWMPPGTFPLSVRRKLRMTSAMLRIALIAGRELAAFARAGAALEEQACDERSWYLQALGVHPRAQRRGIGSRLLRPVLVRADAEGLPCHLHTSDPANVAFYERFGFRVSQPALHVFEDGPAYLGMRRSPGAASGA